MAIQSTSCVCVSCDRCGAEPETDFGTPHYSSVDEARKLLADTQSELLVDERWFFNTHVQLCPDCAEQVMKHVDDQPSSAPALRVVSGDD